MYPNPFHVIPNLFHAMPGFVLALLPLFLLIYVIVAVLPNWFIWKKAGFSPWLSLLMLVPFVKIVMPFVLAFLPWKVMPIPQPPYGSYPPPPPQMG